MRPIVLVAVIWVGACATTTTDWAPSFVGSWNGSRTMVYGGQSSTVPDFLTVSATGTSWLKVGHACPANTDATVGPPATIVSATSFTVGAYTCPTVTTVDGCSTFVHALSEGQGSLRGPTLTVIELGTVTCAGNKALSYTSTFTGTR